MAQAMLPGIEREEIEVQFRSDFSSAKRMVTLFLPDATNAVTPSDSACSLNDSIEANSFERAYGTPKREGKLLPAHSQILCNSTSPFRNFL